MIGSRIGSKGAFYGSVVGSAADDEGPGGGGPVYVYDVDATSLKAVPNNAAQWNDFIADKGLGASWSAPNHLWLCQEAAGNLADSIGALTLTANLAPAYQQVVPGWTRLGVQLSEVASQRFAAAAAAGPNPTTTSQLWVWFVRPTGVAAGVRGVAMISDAGTPFAARTLGTDVARVVIAGVTVDGADTLADDNTQPWSLLYDRTNSRNKLFTAKEELEPAYSAGVLDGNKGLGGGTAAPIQAVYGFCFTGAAAEKTDVQIKALLVAMGFTISWS